MSGSIKILASEFTQDQPLQLAPGIKAGFPSPATDYLRDSLDFNRDLIRNPEATFFGRVVGDMYNFGNVECESDPGTFDRGDEILLTAVPANSNYEFVRWNDGNTDNPRTLVANRDYDLIAEFHHRTQTKQLTVDATYGQATGSGTYHIGDRVDITLVPDQGFHLVHWDDDENETSLTRSFYIQQYTPRYIEAIMESDATYRVHVECDPPESVTVTGNTDSAHYEQMVEIDVTPAPGWRITGWSDDRYFAGDYHNIVVYEDTDLVVFLEEYNIFNLLILHFTKNSLR